MFPLPMKCFLRLYGLWPGYNNLFFYIFVLMSIVTLISQFWNISTVLNDLELLSINISNIIMVLSILARISCFWRKRRYVHDILKEMLDDWHKIKNPRKLTVMKNHVEFVHKFFVNILIIYNITCLVYPFFALQTYLSESVDKRCLPILTKFPFPIKISPIYEIIYVMQTFLLILIANSYYVSDSSYAMMTFHAASKLEFLRFELENIVNEVLKSENKSSLDFLIKKHYKVTKFATTLNEIFSLQIFFNFTLSTLQLCFNVYIYLMNTNNYNLLMKGIFMALSVFTELSLYCVLGEHLQSKSFLIAESAYFIPWYKLQCSDAKMIMIIIQKCQKPITITAGKMCTVTHVTLLNMLKTAVSYLSVLRAARV